MSNVAGIELCTVVERFVEDMVEGIDTDKIKDK
jgi:hypothetical protein